jgi:hypothetical protein
MTGLYTPVLAGSSMPDQNPSFPSMPKEFFALRKRQYSLLFVSLSIS